MAKAIALGADICGAARPFLIKLCYEGQDGLEKYIDDLGYQLKIAMFLTGSSNVKELQDAKYVLSGSVKNWVEQRKILEIKNG